MKPLIITITAVLILAVLSFYLYTELQTVQKNCGRICADQATIDDLLWILENRGLSEQVEKIKCDNSQSGILIK